MNEGATNASRRSGDNVMCRARIARARADHLAHVLVVMAFVGVGVDAGQVPLTIFPWRMGYEMSFTTRYT